MQSDPCPDLRHPPESILVGRVARASSERSHDLSSACEAGECFSFPVAAQVLEARGPELTKCRIDKESYLLQALKNAHLQQRHLQRIGTQTSNHTSTISEFVLLSTIEVVKSTTDSRTDTEVPTPTRTEDVNGAGSCAFLIFLLPSVTGVTSNTSECGSCGTSDSGRCVSAGTWC